MKKTRLSTILLPVLTLLCSIFILASCGGGGGDNNGDDPTPPPTKLTAPTVALTDDTATWDADPEADKFEISVDGNLSYIENSVTSKKLSDGQTFKIRAIGDGTNYTNSDWSNPVTYVKNTPSKYTITWKNGDTVLETDTDVSEGTVPTYDGAEPTKAADAQYSYVFSGWTPEIVAASENATYTAIFTPVINTYTVIWKNGDTTLETDENVTYGSSPSYDGATPTKDATAQYTYTFSGWTPQISSVTGSVTYQAQFTETLRTYTVTFYSEDGLTVLDTVTVEYGSNAVYSKSTPVKNAAEGYTYVFEKWVTAQGGSVTDDLTNVIGDRSVYASFKEFVRTVTVYIVSNNTDYGTVFVSTLNNVPYGATITVNGNTVTINGETVAANANTATAQYTYTFANWTADATVGNDTIITANFSRTVNSYTVTWKNGNDTLETDENVAYGTTPVYNGTLPTKESDNENVYTFSGWSPAISSVTGDITYVAQFTNATNKHTVIYYDNDGITELGRVVVGHGETAVYPNALPTKEATDKFIYTFEKWVTANGGNIEATFENITGDLAVYAKYSVSARTYAVTFCDYDGTILSQIDVAYGNAATAPGDPEREGYRFDGWDNSFDNIKKDTIIKAKYIKQYKVTFIDYDDTILACNYCSVCDKYYKYSELVENKCAICEKEVSRIYEQQIDVGGSAIAPENPVRDNHRFADWDIDFSNVQSDLTVMPVYVKQYTVTFVDYDGSVLKQQTVDEGSHATAPFSNTEERNEFAQKEFEGYDFISWDKSFAEINSDLTVTATYKIRTYTVKFVMPDGTAIGKIQDIEHGFSAEAPEHDKFFLVGSGIDTKVYGFTGWNKSFDKVKEDLTVEAIYDSEYKNPIIILDFGTVTNGNAKLYIHSHSSVVINAVQLSISYKTETGSFGIKTLSMNTQSPFFVEEDGNSDRYDSDPSNDNQYVINNNEKTFTFAWADSNGVSYNDCAEVMTFSFEIGVSLGDGVSICEDNFVIDGYSIVITATDVNGEEKIEEITPDIVYR